MSSPRPPAHGGMRHVALFVAEFDKALWFYRDLMGMAVEWQPDEDNVYLCSGSDNLALHRYRGEARPISGQRLDHIGFVLKAAADVDAWHDFLLAHDVEVTAAPRTHRDGARSFYCLDPDGNMVQLIHHPPIADKF